MGKKKGRKNNQSAAAEQAVEIQETVTHTQESDSDQISMSVMTEQTEVRDGNDYDDLQAYNI